jgi:protein-S-isoprenylcysteine O-methyltransferase Ste14
LLKIAILAGLIGQLFLAEVLPILPDPGVLRRAGALLFTFGLGIAVVGRLQLGQNWSDIEAGQLRSDHALVCRGLYRYIRHPIYPGDLLLLAGLELALNSWLILGVLAVVPYVFRQVAREEQVLLAKLPGYQEYCKRTNRFLPVPR